MPVLNIIRVKLTELTFNFNADRDASLQVQVTVQ